MKAVIIQALLIYGIAAVISMFVAVLIRGLYLLVRRISANKH